MQFIDLKAQQEKIKSQIDSRIAAVLAHGKYIMGPEVSELEEKLQDYTGSPHAIGCANGTDALQLAFMAIEIQPGDEVITTPFTFFATAEMISLVGGVPVLVDIDPESYLLDPTKIEEAITPKTKAIVPVSLYGQIPDMEAINAIAEKHNLYVIEDAAQSFGATRNGKKSCNVSTLATTSFFPSKPLGCYGDGGAIFTTDENLAKKIKMLRVHGAAKRYYHEHIGINSRLDTIQAAILLAKLEIFDWEVEQRNNLGAKYSEMLADSKVVTPKILDGNTHVYGQYTLAVANRESVRSNLQELGVPTAVHYPMPLDQQPASKGKCRVSSNGFSAECSEKVMSLPMHPYLQDSEMCTVVESLRGITE